MLRWGTRNFSHCYIIDTSNNIQNIQKAGREEQGIILVSGVPSVLQRYLSSEVASQAHDISERLQLHLDGDSSMQDCTMN